MASAIENVQGLGLIAIMGGALFLAWKLLQPGSGTQENPDAACANLEGLPKLMCQAGTWVIGADPESNGDITIIQGNDPVPVPVYFCPTLNSVIPVGLSCPTAPANDNPYNPTTDPNQCSPGSTFCEKQGHCVPVYLQTPSYCDPGYQEPWTQPTTIPYIPDQVDYCTWPNGDRLTVPVGMNCQDAVNDMCARFSIFPGYKGCP